jgi:hypothetical protein
MSPADLALVAVVTAMATATAYLRSPRAKSLAYMLPLPFTAAVVSSGQRVDATHALGIAMVWAYPWLVWLLHCRLRLGILLADAAALVVYLAVGLGLSRLVPREGRAADSLFWSFTAVLAASALGMTFVPTRAEPGHRSRMPIYVKVPLLLLIVTAVVLAKNPLRGFMPTFPYVTVFAVYEARRSLHTLAARMPVFVLGFVPFMVICRELIPAWGCSPALALAWAAYLPVYLAVDRLMAARTPALSSEGDLRSSA